LALFVTQAWRELAAPQALMPLRGRRDIEKMRNEK
jgi:hypothetical protein